MKNFYTAGFYINLVTALIMLVVFMGAASNGLNLGEDFWYVLGCTCVAAPVLLLIGSVMAIVSLCRKRNTSLNTAALLIPIVLAVFLVLL